MSVFRCFAVLLVVFLAACSSTAVNSDQPRTYSYVDAQGHLINGVLPAKKTDGQNAGVKGVSNGSRAANDSGSQVGVNGSGYQSAEAVMKKYNAREHDRFVTYYNAEGRIVRQRIDPVAAKKHNKAVASLKHSQVIEHLAAQKARGRQYSQTQTAIPVHCCDTIIKHAANLKVDDQERVGFAGGNYGWVQLSKAHPALAYRLDSKVSQLTIKSYKEKGQYIHPYILFLDKSGKPMLAINNCFQRRFPETWYRYGYLQGRISVPDDAVWLILYLPYETGSQTIGMVPINAPSLVPEKDATPSGRGELVLLASDKKPNHRK